MAKDFVLDWDKELGFSADPFADKILEPLSTFLVNRTEEKEKLNWFFIKSFTYGSMVGEHGVGKTMMLRWLEDRLNRYNRIRCVYINASVFKEQINIPQRILEPLLSFFERHVSKPHTKAANFNYLLFLRKKLAGRSVALLIDNAHNLTEKNLELLKKLREEGIRLQIIVASTPSDYEKSRLSELGHDELNTTLRRLTFDESKEMIVRRVRAFGGRGTGPLTEELMRQLYERADKNPRQFLHLCRDEAIRSTIHAKESSERLLPEKRGFKLRIRGTENREPAKTVKLNLPKREPAKLSKEVLKNTESVLRDDNTKI